MPKRTRSENDWHDFVEERLSAFIDGQLSENERAQVRQHLATCERCQTSLQSLTWTVNLLKQAPAPALPRQFTLPVPDTRTVARPTSPGWLRWGLSGAAALAALAGIILVSASLLSQGSGANEIAMPMAAPAPATQSIAMAPAGAAQPTAAAASNAAPAATSAPAAGAPELNSTDAATGGGALPTTAAAPPVQATRVAPTPTITNRVLAPSQVKPTEATIKALEVNSPTPATVETGGGAAGGAAVTQQPTAQPATAQNMRIPQIVATGVVNDEPLNVRSGPGLEYALLGFLRKGETVQIFGRDETANWLEILFPLRNTLRQTAWVAAAFVTTDVPVRDLAVEPTPTLTASPTPSPTAP